MRSGDEGWMVCTVPSSTARGQGEREESQDQTIGLRAYHDLAGLRVTQSAQIINQGTTLARVQHKRPPLELPVVVCSPEMKLGPQTDWGKTRPGL